MEPTPPKQKSRAYRMVAITFKIFSALCVLLVVAATIANIRNKNDESRATANNSAIPVANSANSRTAALAVPATQKPDNSPPAEQAKFIDMIARAKANFSAAPNDMLKGKVRIARKQELCTLLIKGRATNWVGTILQLSSTSKGDGVLSVEIEGQSIELKTWNINFADEGKRTLLDPKSKLYETVSAMKEGQRVKFSGMFFPDSEDCFKELSLSRDGGITDPEFLFRFDSVEAIW